MKPIQVNEELLSDSGFFASEERRRQLRELCGFDRRRVIMGEGALNGLGEECRRLAVKRVFIVCDPAISALEELACTTLEREGIELGGSFQEIVPNPTVASVDALAATMREVECDAVIAIGGGSTMDTAKVGVCVGTSGGSSADYLGFDLIAESARWPLIAMPTTAGTGAEASCASVIATEAGKQLVYSVHIQPTVAVVDPRLTRDMPPTLTAITALDALGHALECTASKKSNDVGDAVAREALRCGMPHVAAAIEAGADDPEARYHMAKASLLAGLLLGPINTGAAHALGYGIEKVSFEKGQPVPHGTAVALVLPGVMRHNASAVAGKYYFAAAVAGLQLTGRSQEEGASMAADFVDDLRRRYTPFGSLTAAGLSETDIPHMIEIGMSVRRLLDPNAVELTPDDANRIYRAVLN